MADRCGMSERRVLVTKSCGHTAEFSANIPVQVGEAVPCLSGCDNVLARRPAEVHTRYVVSVSEAVQSGS